MTPADANAVDDIARVGAEHAWEQMVSAMSAARSAIIAEQFRIVQESLASYEMELPEFQRESLLYVQMMYDGLVARLPPDYDAARVVCRRLGEVRAMQGATESDLLQAFRIHEDLLRHWIRENTPAGEHRDALIARGLDLVIDWIHIGMVEAAAGHREASLAMIATETRQRDDLVRAVLIGGWRRELHGADVVGLDPSGSYVAVRARPTDEVDVRALEAALANPWGASRRVGLVAVIDGDVCGFVSNLADATLRASVGVSEPMPLEDIHIGFVHASRALEVATRLGCKQPVRFADVALQAAVLADPDVGVILRRRYVDPVAAKGKAGRVVLRTVHAYLIRDLSVARTATDLGLHENTVRYRLGRYEELAGVSLRQTPATLGAWWALTSDRLLGGLGLEAGEDAA